jgi:uncharacterized short protein YbdD (DUF466 family)
MRSLLRSIGRAAAAAVRLVRAASGDDAYERYLTHHALAHGHEGPPLSRRAFYEEREEAKWSGVSRCC